MNRTSHLRDILAGVLILLVQIGLLRHLTIYGAGPDLPLVYVIWIASRHDKLVALAAAFATGLAHDAFLDQWGLNAFSYTLFVLLAHSMLTGIGRQNLLQWQVFLLILAAATLKNAIFLLLGGFVDAFSVQGVFLQMLFIGAAYTAVLGSFLELLNRSS